MISNTPYNAYSSFSSDDFASNPEPRCPVVLVLDTSGSMNGAPIHELNQGLRTFERELKGDDLAARRVDVAIVTFGPVELAADFHTVDSFAPPTLVAGGDTPMGGAMELAMRILEERKAKYRTNGVMFYRPWIFLMSDGVPTDHWLDIARAAKDGDLNKKFSCFAVGIGGADLRVLGSFTNRDALRLDGLEFQKMFVWLSNSMKAISHSRVDDVIRLADPTTGPAGWSSV
jgi:uncharacterized protein YegL